MKKIAVPVRNGMFSTHFGGADGFLVYEMDADGGIVREGDVVRPSEHGRGVYPMWLRQRGVSVVLAGGMGPRASSIFAQHGIEVILGIDGGDPEHLVRAYVAGELESTGELCHDHGFHDCGGHGSGRRDL